MSPAGRARRRARTRRSAGRAARVASSAGTTRSRRRCPRPAARRASNAVPADGSSGSGPARRQPYGASRRAADTRTRLCQDDPMADPAAFPVALYLQDAHDIRTGIELARRAEAAGFDAVWQADSRLVRDAVVPMAAFAAGTERIRIGSGVIDIWTRNAARLASTFSTLDDLAPGRILCGLGAWWDPLATKVGIDRAKPLRVMREVVAAVRGLLANETVSHRRRARPPRRRRAGLRVPGAPGEGRADLHRRHRDADDGARRRDRRRRRPQLPRRPGVQHRSRSPRSSVAPPRAVGGSPTSTARSSSCAASTAIARPRWTAPA